MSASEPERPAAGAAPAEEEPPRRSGRAAGLQLLGVVRARAWRGGGGGEDAADVQRIRYRDMEALVRPTSFTMPPFDPEHVQAHQRVVERAMRRRTILPLPYGVVFRGRAALIRFLEDQYLVLDEGLGLFEGHWELRMHAHAAAPGEPGPEVRDLAVQLYSELRRFARAAVPFPRDGGRVLSAAFLVRRDAWIEFVERVDDLGAVHPELVFDVTGPWPPYDFVRIVV
jgi:hypothetical protein